MNYYSPAKAKRRPFDIGFYLEEMMLEHPSHTQSQFQTVRNCPLPVFDIKSMLCITQLQSKTMHVLKNKISDKLSRRDVHYFDLYALHKPEIEYYKV